MRVNRIYEHQKRDPESELKGIQYIIDNARAPEVSYLKFQRNMSKDSS
jgi:hypothetical protein